MAFDPVQKILAIGTQSGALRLYPFYSGNEIVWVLFFRCTVNLSVSISFLHQLCYQVKAVTIYVFMDCHYEAHEGHEWPTVSFVFLKCDYIMLHHKITSFICFKMMPVVVLNWVDPLSWLVSQTRHKSFVKGRLLLLDWELGSVRHITLVQSLSHHPHDGILVHKVSY